MEILAAAEDNDASDGGADATSVDLPSSSPHTVGCGGTRKSRGAEVVWDEDPGNPNGHGTRGGFSQGSGRMVPDVAANADPDTGHEVVVHGPATIDGGTSAIGPLSAGLFAALGRKLGAVGQPALLQRHNARRQPLLPGAPRDFCTGLGSPIGSKLVASFAAPP